MAAFPPQDRLIRKETALGTIRQVEPPQQHLGSRLLAPFRDVPSDDVIFDYAHGLTAGLAPARAEDAESELAQKDLQYGGTGRASVIDWALKDHYDPSDVTQYQEGLMIQAGLAGVNSIRTPVSVNAMVDELRTKVARDDLLRRRKLDNRLEWMIMTALETGGITYNDGKIKFTVDYGRPSNQTDEAPTGDTWNLTTSDPIGDIIAIQEFMYDTYGVRMTRGIASRKVLNSVLNSDRFIARTGLAVAGTPASPSAPATPIDPRYLLDGWGPSAAQAVIERATNLNFIEYDAVYRTRPQGSNTITNNRFLSDKKIYLLPAAEDVDELDDALGFGATLTSPHPEGGWASGFYEWELETQDPWGRDRGTGIKMFPVFPHLDLTYTVTVLP